MLKYVSFIAGGLLVILLMGDW